MISRVGFQRKSLGEMGSLVLISIKANAKLQATIVAEGSTVISGLVQEYEIKVLAGYYDVTNGKVPMVG